jgi:hypothetical protein
MPTVQEEAPAPLALACGLVVKYCLMVSCCQRHCREGAVLAEAGEDGKVKEPGVLCHLPTMIVV